MDAPEAQVVRAWLVTPLLAGASHPKTAVLRLAARQGAIAVRARKVDAAGAMRVIARGVSAKLAAFHSDLRQKVRDKGWGCIGAEAAAEEVAELEGGGQVILRTADAAAGGANSSGGPIPLPAPASDAASIDTGSSASSCLIVQEVRLERLRGEAVAHQVAAAAAEREAVAHQAAAAAAEREAVATQAAAAAAEREAVATQAAAAAAEREAVATQAAAAAAEREATALEAAAAANARVAALREASVAALMMMLGLPRAAAEAALSGAEAGGR